MSEWKEVRLGDFMEFNPKESLKKGTLAKKITMDMLVPHSRDINSYVVEPYSGGAKFRNGDTIMARITPCLENGKHAFISFLDDKEVAYGSTEYFVMRGKDGVSDNLFVYYLTHSPLFKASAIKSMVGSSGRQRAQVEVLKNLIMPVPNTINKQVYLASILSSLDSKIENNRKICANLEAQAQALFKHWFIDFAPFKDGKFVESELGMIPEGWRVGKLGEIAEVSSGKRPLERFDTETDEHNVPLIGASCVMGYTNEAFMSTKILLTGRVGTLGVIQRFNNACWPSDNTLVLTTQFYEFVYQILKTLNYLGMNRGTSQPLITQGDLKKTSIIIPPDEIINEFEDTSSNLMSIIEQINKESKILSTLRDTLLPKLMSGEIKL